MGSYGEPLATVSDSVYYNAVGLSNGTTYFFVIRASIGIYDARIPMRLVLLHS